jgi:hypothetical protein
MPASGRAGVYTGSATRCSERNMSSAPNGSILPSGPLARLNARNHRGPPSPPAHHSGLHHRVLQPECFQQVRLCLLPLWRRLRRHSAVSRVGRGGVLAARLTRFWRGRSGARTMTQHPHSRGASTARSGWSPLASSMPWISCRLRLHTNSGYWRADGMGSYAIRCRHRLSGQAHTRTGTTHRRRRCPTRCPAQPDVPPPPPLSR